MIIKLRLFQVFKLFADQYFHREEGIKRDCWNFMRTLKKVAASEKMMDFTLHVHEMMDYGAGKASGNSGKQPVNPHMMGNIKSQWIYDHWLARSKDQTFLSKAHRVPAWHSGLRIGVGLLGNSVTLWHDAVENKHTDTWNY